MYIKVHAIAGARRENVSEMKDGVLAVSVKEPAAGNMANKRIRELVAKHLAQSISSVRMVSGHRSRSKMFRVE